LHCNEFVHYTSVMPEEEKRKKNERIMSLVIALIWQVALMTIILGIAFPVFFFFAMKSVYLHQQMITALTARMVVTGMIDENSNIVALAAKSVFLRDFTGFDLVNPEVHGLEENEMPVLGSYFTDILIHYPSFRYFAFFTADKIQPVFLCPFSSQLQLTREQFNRGYAHREWAQSTLAKFDQWDREGRVPVHVSDAFLADPGMVPGITISTVVQDSKGEKVGILLGNMILDRLADFVRSLSFGETGRVYLVDSRGNLLAHPFIPPSVETLDEEGNRSWSLRSFLSKPMIEDVLQGRFNPGVYRLPESGKNVLATCLAVPQTNWYIVVEQETAELFALLRKYIIGIVIIVVCTMTAAAVIFFFISRETAATEKERNELLVISETDPLTGLLNRRSMLSRMRNFIPDFEENHQGFVIGLFDIDDFKKVNDTYGHVFGDVVLREIAARTVSILRVDDLLFRWGGEEFLVVVRNCDLVRGRAIAEKIRRVISDTPISDSAISITVTVTIGMCEYKGGPIDSLIIHADEALYEGKRNGKNRTVVAET